MTTGNRPRRICIVQLTGIGDVVHALPIANDLKRAHPECVVVWVAEPAPAAVLERHPAVDEVVVFDRARGPTGVIDLAAAMRGRLLGIQVRPSPIRLGGDSAIRPNH